MSDQPLSTSFQAKLDAGGLVNGFLARFEGPGSLGAALEAVDVPLSNDALHDAAAPVRGMDLGNVSDAVGRVADALTPVLSALPGASEVLVPIERGLHLVETVTTDDLPAQARALVARLEAVLSGSEDGDFIAKLTRLGEVLGSAPEGQALRSLLDELLHFASADLPAGSLSFPNVLPALSSGAGVLAGLMSLETVLGESERLSGLMLQQIDAARPEQRIQSALAVFGSGAELAARIRALDVTDAAAVAACRTELEASAKVLAELGLGLASGLGFAEATLLYLDVERLTREVGTASGRVRQADLGALERAIGSLGAAVVPLIQRLDTSGLPSFQLDDLLGELETRSAELATRIQSFDLSQVVAPLGDALGQVTQVFRSVGDVMAEVTATVQTALDRVRAAVQAVPIDSVISAIQGILSPISRALDLISSLVAGIEDVIETAAGAAKQALTTVEDAVDHFKHDVDEFFGGARTLVRDLDLKEKIDVVANAVKAAATAIASAELGPYFDTASQAISTTADVVGAVPFNLMPDSMAADVEAALKPIRDVDAGAVQARIEDILQIQDGKFQLRDEISAGVSAVQEKYQALLDVVEAHNPRQYLVALDRKLDALKTKISELVPSVALEPLQAAIDELKATVGGFDLRALLAPVDHAFHEILSALDGFSPAQLLAEPERRLREARERVVGLVQLRAWKPALDRVSARAEQLVERIDPERLEPQLTAALEEARGLLDRIPDTSALGGLGAVVAALVSGADLRIEASTFPVVMGWIGGTGGTPALEQHAAATVSHLDQVRARVQGLELVQLNQSLSERVNALTAAVESLAASEAKTSLSAAVARIDVTAMVGSLVPNRARLEASIVTATERAQTLRHLGFSEVNVTVARLREAWAPLRTVTELISSVTARLGLPHIEEGLAPFLRALLASVTPERLVGLAMPIFRALRARVLGLIAAVLTPIQAAIDELLRSVDALDLAPLRESLEGVYRAARHPIEALTPSLALADPLAAFDALKGRVLGFDVLDEILDVLNAARDTAARLIDKLHAEVILKVPLEIFDEVLAELRSLDIGGLANPLLDAMDVVAEQAHDGLSETVQAFGRLQAALPSGVGGGALSAAVDVSF